jgi:carboxymethylenebutenolidase
MRISLPSGTPAEIDTSVANPKMGLVIAPDIFGLRPLFADLVSRLANEWQMAVIAVEPFPGKDLSADVNERFAEMAKLDDEVHLRDLTEAADVLGVDRVGLIGFCMGGMYCFKAARSERFFRIASFYGMITLPEAWRSRSQGEPLGMLLSGYAENVLAIVGGQDHYTPIVDIDQLRSTGAQVVLYPEAEHGFAHDASRPAHRPEDAADAYARAKDWLLSATL